MFDWLYTFRVDSSNTPRKPRFEPIDREQCFFQAVDLHELIPEGHRARMLWRVVSEMDLSRFAAEVKAVEHHAGRNCFSPQLLIAMWLYAYSCGISSAREIERQCRYEPGLQWLTGMDVVNHHTLSDFRVKHGEALQDLFVQVLAMLSLKKLITLERVTVDGTKIRACVNKKTFSRESKIREHLAVARRRVEELQKEEAEQEQRGRQAAARKRAAREQEARLQEALEEIERLERTKEQNPDKPCQASRTDADAQFMRTGDHGVAPCYNVQLATDAAHTLIVGVMVSKQPSDGEHLGPMMDVVKENLQRYPAQVIADGDYTHRASVIDMSEREIDFYGSWRNPESRSATYGIAEEYEATAFRVDAAGKVAICPEGKRLPLKRKRKLEGEAHFEVYAAAREDCRSCAKRALCSPQNEMPRLGRTVSVLREDRRVVAYHEKMNSEDGKAIYKKRAAVAEFPHAWLKTKYNFLRFRCRGAVKAGVEALWACLAYNLQNYFRLAKAA